MNTSRALNLLKEWGDYRDIHYSQKTEFSCAVDIEIEKSACVTFAEYLASGLLDPTITESELEFRTKTFENHLRILKDRITFELLKHGSSELH